MAYFGWAVGHLTCKRSPAYFLSGRSNVSAALTFGKQNNLRVVSSLCNYGGFPKLTSSIRGDLWKFTAIFYYYYYETLLCTPRLPRSTVKSPHTLWRTIHIRHPSEGCQ